MMIPALPALLGAPLRWELLKHKPGRRSTWRVRGPAGSVIVKRYASDRAMTVAARVSSLSDGADCEPVLPRVLALDERAHAVVLSDVPGDPLGRAAEGGDEEAFRRGGAALGAWHRAWSGRTPAALRAHPIQDELRSLEETARRRAPHLAARVRAAARPLQAPWDCGTAVHRDLYEEQVLMGERVGLIDLDDAAVAPPELDVGNLAAHLDLLGRRLGTDTGRFVQAFIDGYGADRLNLALVDRCRRLSLLRLACIHARPELLELAR
jgi:Ser/Thr protein kinase RdoA (MazF antagonist)